MKDYELWYTSEPPYAYENRALYKAGETSPDDGWGKWSLRKNGQAEASMDLPQEEAILFPQNGKTKKSKLLPLPPRRTESFVCFSERGIPRRSFETDL